MGDPVELNVVFRGFPARLEKIQREGDIIIYHRL